MSQALTCSSLLINLIIKYGIRVLFLQVSFEMADDGILSSSQNFLMPRTARLGSPGVPLHVLACYYTQVYRWCMARTNIDIDEKACKVVMRRYQFSTKREAVNFALQSLATEPFSLDEARRLRGSGWDGNLDEMRTNRST